MNKYFSDWLPPALVRDMRRSLRSRGYLCMLIVFLLLATWFQYDSTLEDPIMGDNSYLMALISMVVLWFIIPSRAGNSVSADAGAKGSNFLMLTPLSSREIVWGTWVSALFQLLLVSGLGALIVWWRVSCSTNPAGDNQWLIYGVTVAVGAMMCAVFLFMSQLSRVLRTLLGVGVLVVCWQVVSVIWELVLMRENLFSMAELKEYFTGNTLYWIVGDYVLVIVLLLEFARRSYAAPAENCSRSVRVLAVLALLTVPLYQHVMAEQGGGQLIFACCYSIFACMSDALLPTYSLVAHDKRVWPLLPAYLQVPGLGQAAFFLLPVLAVVCWLYCRYQEGLMPEPEPMLLHVFTWLNVGYTLLFVLLITDLLCKRDSVHRPIVYAMCAPLLMLATMTVYFMSSSAVRPLAMAAMPFGCNMLSDELSTHISRGVKDGVWSVEVCSALGISTVVLMVTLLLLMWRGRRS